MAGSNLYMLDNHIGNFYRYISDSASEASLTDYDIIEEINMYTDYLTIDEFDMLRKFDLEIVERTSSSPSHLPALCTQSSANNRRQQVNMMTTSEA